MVWCVDGFLPTSCTANAVHAFFNGMGAGILLACLVALTLCADFTLLSASSIFGQRRLVAACPCPQFTHFSVRVSLSLHWADSCRPAQYLQVWASDLQVLAWCPNFWQLKHCRGLLTKGLSRKLPYPLVNLTGCCFPASTIFTKFVGSACFFSVFHLVILAASMTSLSWRSNSSVTQAGTPIMM